MTLEQRQKVVEIIIGGDVVPNYISTLFQRIVPAGLGHNSRQFAVCIIRSFWKIVNHKTKELSAWVIFYALILQFLRNIL